MSRFMSFNFKTLSQTLDLHSGLIQTLMEARREAHLFDISREVSDEVISILDQNDWPIKRQLRFPVPTGYLRMGYDAGAQEIDTGDLPLEARSVVRISGMLWHKGYLYFFHDAPDYPLGVVPLRAEIDYDITGYDKKNAVYVGSKNAPPFCALNMEPIGVLGQNEEIREGFAPLMRDCIAMALVVFDMLGEPAAITRTVDRVEHVFANKNRPFFERTSLVKINLRKCRTKYLREGAEPTGRKIGHHYPIEHWCHYRVTQPDCTHSWVPRFMEDDGKHEKCEKCGEWRTRRALPNGRGDRSIGIIHTHHEVVK